VFNDIKPEDNQVNRRKLIRFTNFKSLKLSSSVTVSSCYDEPVFHQMLLEKNLLNQSAHSLVTIFERHYLY